MMSYLPVVEILADMDTDEARAGWLLTAPDAVILRDFDAVRVLLQKAGFLLGVEFLRMRHAALYAVRSSDGGFPPEMGAALGQANAAMLALSLGPVRAGDSEAG